VREGQGADRWGLGAHVDTDICKTGPEEGFHLLLNVFRQRLSAASGPECEAIRHRENAACVRLDGRRGCVSREDRLRRLRAGGGRGLNGARLELGRQNRPGWLAAAQRRLSSAGRRTSWHDQHRRRGGAGLDRRRHLRPDRRRGGGRCLDDSRTSSREATLDYAGGNAGTTGAGGPGGGHHRCMLGRRGSTLGRTQQPFALGSHWTQHCEDCEMGVITSVAGPGDSSSNIALSNHAGSGVNALPRNS